MRILIYSYNYYCRQWGWSGGGARREDPVALAEGILDLYHHRDKAQHLARCGRQYALEQYSAWRAIDRYEALFYALTSPQVWPGEGEVALAVQK